MSYEDSFEMDAKEHQAYDVFEKDFFYKHCKPAHIGKWAWELMFKPCPHFISYEDAQACAQEMAKERGVSVDITRHNFADAFVVQPSDYYKVVEGRPYRSTTYGCMRGDLKKQMVLEGTFPDIPFAASAMNHSDSISIFNHWINDVVSDHFHWRQAAGHTVTFQDHLKSYRKF